eukprot:1731881-Rhodomonas_salina.1
MPVAWVGEPIPVTSIHPYARHTCSSDQDLFWAGNRHTKWRSTAPVLCSEHDNDDNMRTNRVGWSRFRVPSVMGWGI